MHREPHSASWTTSGPAAFPGPAGQPLARQGPPKLLACFWPGWDPGFCLVCPPGQPGDFWHGRATRVSQLASFWPGMASLAGWPASYCLAGSLAGQLAFFLVVSPQLAGYWPGRASHASWESSGLAGLDWSVSLTSFGLAGSPWPASRLFGSRAPKAKRPAVFCLGRPLHQPGVFWHGKATRVSCLDGFGPGRAMWLLT